MFVPQPRPHHRIRGKYVGVVLIDELLYSLLPHLEHLGSSVLHQGELLQHYFFGSLDLFPQVKLGCLWLRLILLTRDISTESKTNQPIINLLCLSNYNSQYNFPHLLFSGNNAINTDINSNC